MGLPFFLAQSRRGNIMRKDSTQSNTQWHEDFDVKSWQRAWLQERLQHPAVLLVQANEPLQSEDLVYIVAIAGDAYLGASKATKWGLCLIGEQLAADTAD